MTRDQFFQSMKSIFDSMLSLLEAKNADYASSDNPFRNFTTIEAFNLMPAEQAIFVRMSDKMSRIATGLKQTLAVKDESLEDTLKDLANYAVILAVYLRYKNAQTKAEAAATAASPALSRPDEFQRQASVALHRGSPEALFGSHAPVRPDAERF